MEEQDQCKESEDETYEEEYLSNEDQQEEDEQVEEDQQEEDKEEDQQEEEDEEDQQEEDEEEDQQEDEEEEEEEQREDDDNSAPENEESFQEESQHETRTKLISEEDQNRIREDVTNSIEQEREILKKEMSDFEEYKKSVTDDWNNANLTQPIKLNIGGQLYDLPVSVVVKYPLSTLAFMFYGKWTEINSQQEFFIDRDGDLFSHIMEWLNSNCLSIGPNSELLEPLLLEASFYGLSDMKKQLLDLPAEYTTVEEYEVCWPGDWLEMKRKEDHWRDVFVNDRKNPILDNPYLELISIFDNTESFLEQNDVVVPQLCKQNRTFNRLQLAVVNDLSEFRQNFDIFTKKQLERLNWNNVIVAGGAVLASLLPTDATSLQQVHARFHGDGKKPRTKTHSDWKSSDIDLFIYGLTPEEANKKVLEIYDLCCGPEKEIIVTRTEHVVTFCSGWPRKNIQIILRLYKSPAEVLMGFDIDCCCVAYDGKKVWATPRGKRALTYRMNAADPTRQSPSYEFRLHKYGKRGFSVAVPGLSNIKINNSIYSMPLKQLAGLARLLILDFKSPADAIGCTCKLKTPAWRVHRCPQHKAFSLRHVENVDKGIEDTLLKGPKSCYETTFLPYGPHYTVEDLYTILRFRNDMIGNDKLVWTKMNEKSVEDVLFGYGVNDQTSDKNIPEKVQWITENPGKQLTASFHPTHEDWFKQAYSRSFVI